MATGFAQTAPGATQIGKCAGLRAGFAALLADSAIILVIGLAIVIASARPTSAAEKALPAQAAKENNPPTAAPPPAPVAKKAGRTPARSRRSARPAALTAPAPAAASAPAAEPRIITPKYNDVMTAVIVGDEDAVNQLLELGWWVDKPSSIGLTPLMAAVMNRDARMVQVLLTRGADPNAQAPGGVTALKLARDRNDAVTAALLEQMGAR